MGNIAAWLGALAWPLVTRVLVGLGLGTVTYVGADAALTSALSAAKGALGQLGSEVASILAMAGFFQALAITAGGMTASLSWIIMKRFALKVTG